MYIYAYIHARTCSTHVCICHFTDRYMLEIPVSVLVHTRMHARFSHVCTHTQKHIFLTNTRKYMHTYTHTGDAHAARNGVDEYIVMRSSVRSATSITNEDRQDDEAEDGASTEDQVKTACILDVSFFCLLCVLHVLWVQNAWLTAWFLHLSVSYVSYVSYVYMYTYIHTYIHTSHSEHDFRRWQRSELPIEFTKKWSKMLLEMELESGMRAMRPAYQARESVCMCVCEFIVYAPAY